MYLYDCDGLHAVSATDDSVFADAIFVLEGAFSVAADRHVLVDTILALWTAMLTAEGHADDNEESAMLRSRVLQAHRRVFPEEFFGDLVHRLEHLVAVRLAWDKSHKLQSSARGLSGKLFSGKHFSSISAPNSRKRLSSVRSDRDTDVILPMKPPQAPSGSASFSRIKRRSGSRRSSHATTGPPPTTPRDAALVEMGSSSDLKSNLKAAPGKAARLSFAGRWFGVDAKDERERELAAATHAAAARLRGPADQLISLELEHHAKWEAQLKRYPSGLIEVDVLASDKCKSPGCKSAPPVPVPVSPRARPEMGSSRGVDIRKV
jgi:hypothetical protein